jgi:hypothetical protein
VFNRPGIEAAGGEVIVCESLIDALSFWVHGQRHVTAAYGTQGFTAEHLAALKTAGVSRVLIAFDRDEAGDAAAAKLAQRLAAEGLDCFRVLFGAGGDANRAGHEQRGSRGRAGGGAARGGVDGLGRGAGPLGRGRAASRRWRASRRGRRAGELCSGARAGRWAG